MIALHLHPGLVALACLGALLLAGLLLVRRSYVHVGPQHALITRWLSGTQRVHFERALVFPVVTYAERMALGPTSFVVAREKGTGLVCADALRADVRVEFQVKVARTEHSVARVAGEVGCERATKQDTLEGLFSGRFAEAMHTAAARLTLDALARDPVAFVDSVIAGIGSELRGYQVHSARVISCQRTAREHLDPNNIHDARALRRLDELEAEGLEGEERPPSL